MDINIDIEDNDNSDNSVYKVLREWSELCKPKANECLNLKKSKNVDTPITFSFKWKINNKQNIRKKKIDNIFL